MKTLCLYLGLLSFAQAQIEILGTVSEKLTSETSFATYDQDRRFIWTCFNVKNPKKTLKLTANLVLENRPVCLCQPGGVVDNVGLHVSHIKGLNKNSQKHLIYREISLEKQECQSFAGYSQ